MVPFTTARIGLFSGAGIKSYSEPAGGRICYPDVWHRRGSDIPTRIFPGYGT